MSDPIPEFSARSNAADRTNDADSAAPTKMKSGCMIALVLGLAPVGLSLVATLMGGLSGFIFVMQMLPIFAICLVGAIVAVIVSLFQEGDDSTQGAVGPAQEIVHPETPSPSYETPERKKKK